MFNMFNFIAIFFIIFQTTLILTVGCPRLRKVHVAVCHGDQWDIYLKIEDEYSGVNNYFKAIGVELRFSNPYVSAHSSMQSLRQDSDDEESMLSLDSDADDED